MDKPVSVINKIIDDVWIKIFWFLNCNDFQSIREICNHFNNITNPQLTIINKYWKYSWNYCD